MMYKGFISPLRQPLANHNEPETGEEKQQG